MPTNQEILDAGVPDLPDPIPDDGSLDPAAERYGNALLGVWGREGAPTMFGAFLRAIVPQTFTGVAVTANQVTLPTRGCVVAVDDNGGPAEVIRPAGTPSGNEVLVEYSDGYPTLTFSGGVTACDVQQQVIPDEIWEFLDATSNPP